MDYRYFHKRKYYLGVIKQGLEALAGKSDSPISGAEFKWENTHGDPNRPMIVVSLGKGES